MNVQLESSPGMAGAETGVVPPPPEFLVLHCFLFAGSKVFLCAFRELVFQGPLVLCLGAFGTIPAGRRGLAFLRLPLSIPASVPPSFPAPCLPRRGGCRGCMCWRRAAPTVRLCRSGETPQSTGCMHKQSIYMYTWHLQRHTRTVMLPYIYVDVCICIQILYICMHMHTYTCVYTQTYVHM